MYKLKAEQSFDAAHFLAGYEGKCRNIHGHRWRIVVEVQQGNLVEEGQMRGMVVDFGDLKRDLKAEVDYFDHSLIVESGTLRPETMKALLAEEFKITEVAFRTTAENFAEYFYEKMSEKGYNVKEATVYETPDNCASYSRMEV